jgi:ATP-dependent RNA helicase DeaD
MVKLFLSIGKNQRINPGDIVGMLHNECHLERGTVGRIQLFPNFSLVEVAQGEAARAIEHASGATLRGLTFKIDYDRGPREGGSREGGSRDGGPREGGFREGGFRRDAGREGGFRKPGGSGPQRNWDDRGFRGERRGGDRYDDRPRGGGGNRPTNRDRYDRGRRDRD